MEFTCKDSGPIQTAEHGVTCSTPLRWLRKWCLSAISSAGYRPCPEMPCFVEFLHNTGNCNTSHTIHSSMFPLYRFSSVNTTSSLSFKKFLRPFVLEYCFVWLREQDIKKIVAQIFGNAFLKKNGNW